MKKFWLFTITALLVITAKAQQATANQTVLESLMKTQAAPHPQFPIMPKRVVKPRPKKVVIKQKEIAKPQVKEIQKTEQQSLQKEFDSMQPVVTQTKKPTQQQTAIHQPKTLELMPGAKVADIKQNDKATKQVQKELSPTPVKITPITKEAQVTKIVKEPTNNKITFANSEAKLSEENKKQIDEVLKSFSDPQNDKIAITAYNLEDSKNAFKQKRQALNHAMEVRNYLVTKGFNNSSLRVIGTKNEPNKLNVVEISKAQ